MPTTSDSLLVADSIRDILAVNIPAAGFPTANIFRAYEIEFDLGKFTLMQVPLFPISNEDISRATRAESTNDIMGCIVIAERYADAGRVPNAWMDARVVMVENAIWSPLNVIEQPLLTVGDYEYWPKTVQITSVFDVKFYRKHKVFWSEVEYTVSRLRVR